jgi:hypothetical protein
MALNTIMIMLYIVDIHIYMKLIEGQGIWDAEMGKIFIPW